LSIALFAPSMSNTVLILVLSVIALATGPTMPVVQMTVQVVAGPRLLGAAAASVQFSRSIGAATGTALVGAVLFAMLAARDPATAASFASLVERGPHFLAEMPMIRRELVRVEIADAFRAVFLTIACFTTGGLVLAWSLPVRRI
jgi:hypothetical protein